MTVGLTVGVAVGPEGEAVGDETSGASGAGAWPPDRTVVAVAAPPIPTTSIVAATSTVRAFARGKKRLMRLRVTRVMA